MDWAIALEQYEPGSTYELDDSANPSAVVVWNGTKPEPTEADLQAAWDAWKQANPDPPDWDGLLAEAVLSPLYGYLQTVAAGDGVTAQYFSGLQMIMTSDKLQNPMF